jgi:CRISPR-associated protein Cmr4
VYPKGAFLASTKTVAEGALWTQEMLPSDTLLMSNVIVRSSRNEKSQRSAEDVIKWLHNSANIPSRIQIGGDETTGQGFVALRWSTGA